MMKEEFIEALKKVPAYQDKNLNLFLTKYVWDAIQYCYASQRLDNILSGNDRHYQFALWVSQNEKAISIMADAIKEHFEKKRKEIQRQISDLLPYKHDIHAMRCIEKLQLDLTLMGE
jgi:hypothetical protein